MSTTRRRNSRTPRSAKSERHVIAPDSRLVRLPRVRTALERIESGYYDRDEVRDRLAVAVLKALLTE